MKSPEIPYIEPEIHDVGHGVYFASTVGHAAQRPTEQYVTEAMHRYLVLISWTWSYDVEIPRREQYPPHTKKWYGRKLPTLLRPLRIGPNSSENRM